MKQNNRIPYRKIRDRIITHAIKWEGATLQSGGLAPGVMGFINLLKDKKLNLKRLSKDIENEGYHPTKLMIAPMNGGRGKFVLYYVINYDVEGEFDEIR